MNAVRHNRPNQGDLRVAIALSSRTTRCDRFDRRGFTLIELIVVVAIIALIAGLALPGMVKMIGNNRRDVQNAARDIYTMLAAARVYASTFRVDCAVVYTVAERPDSAPPLGTNVFIIDGIGVARRVHADEIPFLVPPPEDADSAYILVSNDEGRLRTLPKPTCIQSISDTTNTFAATPDDFQTTMTGEGMRSVQLYSTDRELIAPRAGADYLGLPALTSAFPAHVFRPTGDMDVETTLTERFVLDVGPAPDVDLGDRFLDPDNPTEPVAPINVELYASTGRVRIAS